MNFVNFTKYWQTKGWLWMFIGAVVLLGMCWLISERHNIQGTYDKYNIVSKNQSKKTSGNKYFPQSIEYNDRRLLTGEYNPYTYDASGHLNRSGESGTKSRSRVPTNSKGEEICRSTLEMIFQRPFQKCRPSFLYNSVTGENLELDMYNKELGIAVEYNGQQHYKYNSFMHGGSKDKFYGQQYRDRMKKDICKKLGILLIEVPYTVKHDKIPEFLYQKLRETGVLR